MVGIQAKRSQESAGGTGTASVVYCSGLRGQVACFSRQPADLAGETEKCHSILL